MTSQRALNSCEVSTGDAHHLDWLLPEQLRGQVALMLTSPPYGPSTHRQVSTGAGGVHKRNHRYERVMIPRLQRPPRCQGYSERAARQHASGAAKGPVGARIA